MPEPVSEKPSRLQWRWFESPPSWMPPCLRAALIALAIIVLFPLAVAFVQAPLQISDVLTSPDVLFSPKGDFTSVEGIRPNYLHALMRSSFLVRPTQVLVNNLQYVLFGPEQGAMYAIKWAVKFASAFLLVWVLRRLGVDELSRYAAAALVLFHPACLDPLLWSADGQAVFLMLATIGLSLRAAPERGLIRIEQIGRAHYLALFALWFLLLGVKESCFVVCGCLALVWQITSLRSARAWVRLMPFHGMLAFWAYRLATVRAASSYASSVADVAGRVAGNARIICAPSPMELLGIFCLLMIGLALLAAWRGRDLDLRWALLFFAGAAAGGVLFVSIPPVLPSARYNMTAIYLVTLIIGLGMAHLPRMAWPLKPLFVLLMPAWMAGDLYTQTLAFIEDTYEYNGVLNYLESGAGQGYSIACSGEFFEQEGLFGREAQDTVKYYFEKYGPRFYGIAAGRHVYFIKDGDCPPDPYQLLTSYSPASLEKGAIAGLDVGQILRARQVVRGRQGLLSRMTAKYVALAHRLGNDHWPVYDMGTYPISDASRYFIYTVDRGEKRSGPLEVARIATPYRAGAFIR